MVRMDVAHLSRNCAVTSRFDGALPPSSNPRIPIAHTAWVGERFQRQRLRAGEVRDQRRADRPAPARRLLEHRSDLPAMLGREAFDGVDGAEHLGQIGADRLEVEGDVVVAVVPMADERWRLTARPC